MWNRISDNIQGHIVEMALEHSELSPRELAVRFTDERQYFVSEATTYRLLKAHDLITSPAFPAATAPRCCASPGCSATTVPTTSPMS